MVRVLTFTASIVGVSLFASLPEAAAAELTAEQRAIVKRVIETQAANYARIHTIQATVHTVSESSDIDRPTESVTKGENGSILKIMSSPRTEVTSQYVQQGDRFRADSETTKESYGDLTEWYKHSKESCSFADGIWVRVSPLLLYAETRDATDYSPPNYWDLRDLATSNLANERIRFHELLRNATIHDASIDESETGDRVATLRFDRPGGTVVVTCSEAESFLPVHMVAYYDDQTIYQCREIAYQDVLDGDTKLLRKLLVRTYRRGAANEPNHKEWNARQNVEITDVVVNDPIADEQFVLTLPDGTRMQDHATGGIRLARERWKRD